jgi:hypothetical protein
MLENMQSNGLLTATTEAYRRGGEKSFYKGRTNSNAGCNVV